MKNITYSYANERVGLTYTCAIRVDKESETHKLCSFACAVLTTADVSRRQEIKMFKIHFTKPIIQNVHGYPLSTQNIHM